MPQSTVTIVLQGDDDDWTIIGELGEPSTARARALALAHALKAIQVEGLGTLIGCGGMGHPVTITVSGPVPDPPAQRRKKRPKR